MFNNQLIGECMYMTDEYGDMMEQLAAEFSQVAGVNVEFVGHDQDSSMIEQATVFFDVEGRETYKLVIPRNETVFDPAAAVAAFQRTLN